jgi:hypothetical protein
MTKKENSVDSSELELKTKVFFDRPAGTVAGELADRVFQKDVPETVTGNGKIIEIETNDGVQKWRVTVAESYSGDTPGKVWSGKRSNQIGNMESGGIITYSYRGRATLSFIKTKGIDNILIRGMINTKTEQVAATPTQVSQVLGLSVQQEGRVTFSPNGNLRFTRT